MKIVLIDGDKIKTFSGLHNEFKKVLDFPAYYGENLDALYDVLTDIKEELGVIIVKNKLLRNNLGKKWENFILMLEELNEEKTDFYFMIAPFGK